jgi:molybdenum-dependent DNA-binding transcriptional regulator ModE
MAALGGLGRETRHEPATRPPRSSHGAMDWDDVRVFLAVAREGSMRAAGRALGLSQPTIARRLAAFEATFGGQTLFDRLPEGLRLNAAGEQLVAAAESVEDAVLTLERRRAAASPELERYSARIDRRMRRRVFGSLPVRTDNDGASVRHHLGTGRLATDGKPRATRSRYGVAPSAAGNRRLLHLQGRHLRLRGLPASRRGCRCVGHLYRGASTL